MSNLPSAPTPLRPGRRWLFRLTALALLYALSEAAALVGFRLLDGASFSFSRLQRERRKVSPHGPEGLRAGGAEDFVYVPHPYLGAALNPRYRRAMPGYDPVTEFGFTGKGSPVHKRAPGKVIVGITGGSVACMFGAQGTQALAQELKRAPAYVGKEIVFVNLAIPTHKQPQQVMALTYALALGGEFDILVNLDGFNEVALYPADSWPKGLFPLFPRDWDRIVTRFPDPTQRRLNGEIGYLQGKRRRWADWFAASPLRFSVTANLLWRGRDRVLASETRRCEMALQRSRPTSLPYCALGPGHRLHSEDEIFPELVGIWKRCSRQLAQTCKGHGIRYFHFLQPNQYVPASKPLSPRERKDAWDDGDDSFRPSVEKGYPLLRQAGRELAAEGVCFRDLTMAFADRSESLYVDTCCHFNRGGNEIVAAAIARALLETAEPPR